MKIHNLYYHNVFTYLTIFHQDEPFVIASPPDSSGNVSWSGVSIELVKLLAQKIGFDYKIRLTNHKDYGHVDETSGAWEGLLSEVAGSVSTG